MTGLELLALSPVLAVAAASVVVMLLVALRRSHEITAAVTVASLGAALALVPVAGAAAPLRVTPLLLVDGFALFHTAALLVTALIAAALAWGYLRRLDDRREEFYLLLLLATLGAIVLAASSHFASFFLGLETLSVALYGLIAYRRSVPESLEAGIKYLLLSGTSSAFLLFGAALLYAESGTLELQAMAAQLAAGAVRPLWFQAGLGLVLVAVGFKLALVPFHLWTPDVFQGSPAPTTALLATVSKGGVVAALVRFAIGLDAAGSPAVLATLGAIAVLTIVVGNVLAIGQRSLKRLLAASSIAHMGYVLVGVIAIGDRAAAAVSVYMAAYFAASLAAFGVIAVLSTPAAELDEEPAYAGLSRRHPWLALVLTLALLSLLGVPLTAGFIGKYWVIVAGLDAALWVPVFAVIGGTVISAGYYLRVIKSMYFTAAAAPAPAVGPEAAQAAAHAPPPTATLTWPGRLALAAATLAVIWLGVQPSAVIDVITPAAAALAALP